MTDLLSSPPSWRERVAPLRRLPPAVLIGGGGAVAVAVVALVLLAGHRSSPPELRLPRADTAPSSTETTSVLVVDVAGAVARPGLVRLPHQREHVRPRDGKFVLHTSSAEA